MSDTVLIAPSDKIPELSRRPDLAAAIAYSDADPVAALNAIVTGRPSVVVLEVSFADTPRGVALIERIKRDPALEACVIRIIGDVGEEPTALAEKLARLARTRLAEECAKLDPVEEGRLADDAFGADTAWPE